MVPTRFLYILLLLCAVGFLLAMARPELAAPSLAWGLAMIGVALVDQALTRYLARFSVTREMEPKLSLGAPNRIRLVVRNRSPRPLRLVIKDDPPHSFRTPERHVRAAAAPFETVEAGYTTVPQSRGEHTFGDLHVRGLSLLRLTWWQHRVPARETVSVYPNLLDVRRYDLLARSRRLQEMGFRTLRRRGAGTEFESLREYVKGDEFRSIDWKATARRGKPIARQYEAERSQNVMILVDAGRMMSAQLAGMSKLDYAVNAALMLAHVCLVKGDAVGLLVFADSVRAFLPPRKDARQAGRILDVLHDTEVSLQEPDYTAAFYTLRHRARKRALVVVFTDLIDVEASRRLLSHTANLYPRHLPLLVTVSDDTLTAAAYQRPQTEQEAFERAVANQVLMDREQALGVLRSLGALTVDVSPEQLSVATINQYLQLKGAGRL